MVDNVGTRVEMALIHGINYERILKKSFMHLRFNI